MFEVLILFCLISGHSDSMLLKPPPVQPLVKRLPLLLLLRAAALFLRFSDDAHQSLQARVALYGLQKQRP